MTEHEHTVSVPRALPSLPKVTVGTTSIRSLKFTRLELFFNLALTTVTSDNWHELNFEVVSLMYGMGRHLELTPGLVVSTASRSGGRSTKLRLADYLKSGFAGQLGAGVAALYARELGAVYLAHAEDVDDGTVARLTRLYARRAPPSSSGKAPRMSTRKGDFVTVNARNEFGMLEAKATAGSGKVQRFMDSSILDGALWQIDPFVPGMIQTMSTTPGTAPLGADIQHGVVSGLNIHESPAGAAIHAIRFKLPVGHPVAGGLSGSAIATAHFRQWWRLFNLAFINLTLPPRAIDLPILTMGSMSFVVNIPVSRDGYDMYELVSLSSSRQLMAFSLFRQEGWGTRGFWKDGYEDKPLFIAIEEGIFRQLLAVFTGRRGVREERDETGRFKPVRQPDIEATGQPEAIHSAVNRFQAQLIEHTGLTQDEDPTGQRQVQAWNTISSDQLGNEVVTATFREGVMAFAGFPRGDKLIEQRFSIEAEQ